MTEFENEQILHQLYLERYKNGETKKIIKILNNANKLIKKELKLSDNVYSKSRYQKISKTLNLLSKKLKNTVGEELDKTDLITEELETQRKLLEKQGITDIVLPDEKKIRTAVQFKPFGEKSNYDTFLNSIQTNFYDTWDNAVRSGFITGETTDNIIKEVMGVVAKNADLSKVGTIQNLYNSIERNTRTYLQSMATTARNTLYAENDKYFDGYKWLSTLDRKSCLICGGLDNQVRENLEDWNKELPPLHFNCRCVIVPIIKGFEDFNGKRAGTDGYSDENTSYEDWLKAQSVEVQKDILGARYNLYKNGTPITQFVNDGKILTLKEIKDRQ